MYRIKIEVIADPEALNNLDLNLYAECIGMVDGKKEVIVYAQGNTVVEQLLSDIEAKHTIYTAYRGYYSDVRVIEVLEMDKECDGFIYLNGKIVGNRS